MSALDKLKAVSALEKMKQAAAAAKVRTKEYPGESFLSRTLANLPTPEEVLSRPEQYNWPSRFLAGAVSGVQAAVTEAAKGSPFASKAPTPQQFIGALASPITIPISGLVSGITATGALSPRTVEQLGKSAEALMPLGMPGNVVSESAIASLRSLAQRLNLPRISELAAKAVRKQATTVTPTRKTAGMLTEGEGITIPGPAGKWEAGPGGYDWIKEYIHKQLDRLPPQLHDHYVANYRGLVRMGMSEAEAAHVIFDPLGPMPTPPGTAPVRQVVKYGELEKSAVPGTRILKRRAGAREEVQVPRKELRYPTTPQEMGDEAPTTKDVMLERVRTVGETTGDVPYSPETHRNIPLTRFSEEVPNALEQAQARATQLVEKPLPQGESYIINRPGVGSVEIAVGVPKQPSIERAGRILTTPPVTDATVSVTNPITGEVQHVPGGIINYGPVYRPTNLTPDQSWFHIQWQRLKNAAYNIAGRKLPADPYIAQVKDSMVLADMERARESLTDFANRLITQPWFKAIEKHYTNDMLEALEHKAVMTWVNGGRNAASYAKAKAQLPPEIQEYLTFRDREFIAEQIARQKLGLELLPAQEGPYLPRLTKEDFDNIFRIRKGGSSMTTDFQQTIRSFQKSREYPTQQLGKEAGIEYLDMRQAILMREFEGHKLRVTAQLMDDLKAHGIIYESKEAALEASRAIGQNKAYLIKGMPGADKAWYARSWQEGQFIEQNLTKAQNLSYLSGWNHWFNLIFRNMNLINPMPHFVKNMYVKYLLAGGRKDPTRLFKLIDTFNKEKETELGKLFKVLMPYSESGMTAEHILARHSFETTLGKRLAKNVEKVTGSLQRMSAEFLFSQADPALRYDLWKTYLKKGFSPIDAANHVHVDLIRYATRSDLVDFWKKLPMNFFVPWRLGSVTSVVKQAITHPIRTALVIGAIDYIREVIYRKTGYHFHLPTDYIEGPIARLLEANDKVKALVYTTLTTGLFGPGGNMAPELFDNVISSLKTDDPVEYRNITTIMKDLGQMYREMFWGLSAMREAGKETYDTGAAILKGKYAEALQHIVSAAAGWTLGAHKTMTYNPKRFAAAVPQWFPGMKYSPEILLKEEMIKQMRERREHNRIRQLLRQYELGKPTERMLKKYGLIE